tara:strand:+ start:6794 stop:7531 length:738 start_codon:yes stop_codon:yes gene_type:complete
MTEESRDMAKELILVIEDERAIADTTVYALEREGFDTHWSATGADGLLQLENKSPTMIILDIGLPDTNGLDLCRQIRQDSQIPIIFLSARNEELDRILGLELGGDDYITKPFSPRELVARVRSVLRRHHTSAMYAANHAEDTSEVHTVGPFEDDAEQMRIRYKGESLDLSRYEYRLLSLLLSRPNKVFSREEILERAWEEPEMTTDRTVDAHIKSIRKKLKEVDAESDPIRTVRGVGYAMETSIF